MNAVDAPFITCRICKHPLTITTCTVDEHGNAVHVECYEKKLLIRSGETLIVPPKNENEATRSLAFANSLTPFFL
jgi:hypothetical protein